jgi:hypothetical protein
MSPEQARGDELGSQTDLFNAGAVLYEMCTGHLPFAGKTSAVIFHKILEEAPPAPRAFNPSLPAKLEEIVLKALEKDRELRYQTSSELRADLKRLKRDLASSPGAAAPSSDAALEVAANPPRAPGSTTILVHEARRHKVGTAVTVSLLLALVSATALGIYLLLQRESSPPTAGQQMRITRLTNSDDVTGCTNISPDGKHVVYCSAGGGGGPLWVRQVATGATVKLHDRFGFADTTFSPDGNVIYVRRNSDAGGTLYVIPALGGEPRELLTQIRGPVAVSPKAISSPLYARASGASTAGRPTLWKMPAGGGEAVRMPSDSVPLAIAPDGQGVLARLVRPGGPPQAHIVRILDGSVETTAPIIGSWTPDGQSLVVINTQGGLVSNLRGYPVDGSAHKQLTRFESDRIFSFVTQKLRIESVKASSHALLDVHLSKAEIQLVVVREQSADRLQLQARRVASLGGAVFSGTADDEPFGSAKKYDIAMLWNHE